jgi:putative acetyltransferase
METDLKIIQVSPEDKFVQMLIKKLDQFQIDLYGVENCHLDSFEELKNSKAYMVGAYIDNQLIGIGAVKLFAEYAELKRMYLDENQRGKGIAEKILAQLEKYVQKTGIKKVYLETGVQQKPALNFYKKNGYSEVEKFGNYETNEVSVFLGKILYT